MTDNGVTAPIGISQAASIEPYANQDANVWHAGWPTRIPCLMDRPR
jgi:hypothetical protein